jgi:hypothetical protein
VQRLSTAHEEKLLAFQKCHSLGHKYDEINSDGSDSNSEVYQYF